MMAKWILGSNVPYKEGLIAELMADSVPWLIQPFLAVATALVFGIVYIFINARFGVNVSLRNLLRSDTGIE